jgi:hypothetical protein
MSIRALANMPEQELDIDQSRSNFAHHIVVQGKDVHWQCACLDCRFQASVWLLFHVVAAFRHIAVVGAPKRDE